MDLITGTEVDNTTLYVPRQDLSLTDPQRRSHALGWVAILPLARPQEC